MRGTRSVHLLRRTGKGGVHVLYEVRTRKGLYCRNEFMERWPAGFCPAINVVLYRLLQKELSCYGMDGHLTEPRCCLC